MQYFPPPVTFVFFFFPKEHFLVDIFNFIPCSKETPGMCRLTGRSHQKELWSYRSSFKGFPCNWEQGKTAFPTNFSSQRVWKKKSKNSQGHYKSQMLSTARVVQNLKRPTNEGASHTDPPAFAWGPMTLPLQGACSGLLQSQKPPNPRGRLLTGPFPPCAKGRGPLNLWFSTCGQDPFGVA